MSLADKKGKQRPLVDGLATETTLAALSHAEDSAHATGDKGIPMWGVRVDAYLPDGGVFGADGDYTPIATNYKGDVKVAPQNVAGATINPATEEKQDVLIGNYATLLDDVSTSGMTYVGKALIGSATSGALWQIKRIDESGTPTTLVIKWADGDASFNNIWDNRTSISYS